MNTKNKMVTFKVTQVEEDMFLVHRQEVRVFQGKPDDYIYIEDEQFVNCSYLEHKTNKQLSGLIR